MIETTLDKFHIFLVLERYKDTENAREKTNLFD